MRALGAILHPLIDAGIKAIPNESNAHERARGDTRKV